MNPMHIRELAPHLQMQSLETVVMVLAGLAELKDPKLIAEAMAAILLTLPETAQDAIEAETDRLVYLTATSLKRH